MHLLSSLPRVLVGLLRRTWLVALVTILVCAAFAARAVAALVDAERLTEAPVVRPPAARPAAPEPPRRAPDPTGFVARNIFCSSCGGGGGGGGGAKSTGEPAELIATMLGRDPRATVRVLSSEVQGSWGLGERIPGVGQLERIGGSSIDVVDGAGERRTLSLLPAAAADRTTAAATDAATSAAAAGPFADRIKQLGDGTFEVDRGLVRELVGGGTKAGGVRVLPVVEGADVKGVRLYGVRGDSVAGALGLRSGDLINAIDGTPIKNAQQLLDLYARLDQVSGVELSGIRRGKPLALSLRLR